jgi:hypothetical protein
MRFVNSSFFVLALGLALGVPAAGCAASSENTEGSASELQTTVHAPQGDERKAIIAAYKKRLSTDFHGQQVFLLEKDPEGRFLAHGEWAYFEGVVEGPDDNRTAIDYANSEFAKSYTQGFLAGEKINGNFAVKFQSLAHREADGSWTLAPANNGRDVAYAVGPNWEAWKSWVSLPVPELRDIFAAYPIDDVHEPKGADRDAILAALRAQVTTDVHGQAVDFNVVDPAGVFLQHDGWAYLSGIVVGPNDNATAVDYRNSIYNQAGTGFQGVLHNNNFAAIVRALLKREADGTWHIQPSNKPDYSTPGYTVGKQVWVGDPSSDFAWDIFGKDGGNGNGNGDGDGG